MRDVDRRFSGLIWGPQVVRPAPLPRRRKRKPRPEASEVTPAQRRAAGWGLFVMFALMIGAAIGGAASSPAVLFGCLAALLVFCIATSVYVRVTEGSWPSEDGAHFW